VGSIPQKGQGIGLAWNLLGVFGTCGLGLRFGRDLPLTVFWLEGTWNAFLG